MREIVCKSCDLAIKIDELKDNYDLVCPRCGNRLVNSHKTSLSNVAIVAFSAVQFLFISIFVPFMSISVIGITQQMSLYNIVDILAAQWGLLLYSFLFFTFLSPFSVLISIILIGGLKIRPNILWLKYYKFCHSMCMVDVFVLGICVSLIKLTSLVEVYFNFGFYSTFIFSILIVWCCARCKPIILWNIYKEQENVNLISGVSAINQSIKKCPECGYFFRSNNDFDLCPRCHHKVYFRKNKSYFKCISLLISAIILYLPSNLYPVMYTNFLGATTGSNIMEGVIAMWNMNSYFVAIVILLASIFIPAFKIVSIAIILYTTKNNKIRLKRRVSKLYRFVLFIGRWSLIDVYVVIIMSAIVRISGFLTIYPGFAIICFCAVVIITVFSADEFDERLIWDSKDN